MGGAAVKKLFIDNLEKVAKTFGDAKSCDRKVLTVAINAAIKDGDIREIAKIWSYVVARHRTLKSPLTEEEAVWLASDIERLASERVYILSRGAIEAYLPAGKTSLEATVSFIGEGDCIAQMEATGASYQEIVAIFRRIGGNE